MLASYSCISSDSEFNLDVRPPFSVALNNLRDVGLVVQARFSPTGCAGIEALIQPDQRRLSPG